MISICLIYSNERLPQTEQVIEYLKVLPYYKAFDLIQICDGEPSVVFDRFRPIVVPRRNPGFFCRADLWNGGIGIATKNVVLILDCDRLPHPDFFGKAATLEEGSVLYCSKLYQLWKHESLSTIVQYFDRPIPLTFARQDFRVVVDNGTIRPAKNPMSGCVAFWRSDYEKSGGLSTDFIGWGFNDTDYYLTAYMYGLKFVAAPLTEFHLYHDYTISRWRLLSMNAWNAVRFYDKWRMPIHRDVQRLLEYLGTTANFVRSTSLETFLEVVG